MKFNFLSLTIFFVLSFGTVLHPNFIFSEESKIENQSLVPSKVSSDHEALDPHHDGHSIRDFHFQNFPEGWHEHLGEETESFEAKFFNMLFILALLIGFMILAAWALKRMMKSKMTQLNTGSSIKILETRYLSPRATLYLIEIQGQNVLIAESPTVVSFLKTFRPEE